MIPILLTALLAASAGTVSDRQPPRDARPSATSPAPSTAHSEEPGVRQALDAYLQGHATGRAEHFQRAFHSDAKLFFNRDGAFSQLTSAEYIARAGTGTPPPDEDRRKRRIDFIDITGDTAVAKITLDYPSVLFTDYMSLVKVGAEWKIVNKIFHAVRR